MTNQRTMTNLMNLKTVKTLLCTLDYAELQLVRDMALTQMLQIKRALEDHINFKG